MASKEPSDVMESGEAGDGVRGDDVAVKDEEPMILVRRKRKAKKDEDMELPTENPGAAKRPNFPPVSAAQSVRSWRLDTLRSCFYKQTMHIFLDDCRPGRESSEKFLCRLIGILR